MATGQRREASWPGLQNEFLAGSMTLVKSLIQSVFSFERVHGFSCRGPAGFPQMPGLCAAVCLVAKARAHCIFI